MVAGIIYILVNEAMPGYIKIGKTSTSVAQRIRELDGTSLPYPFECFYAAMVADMDSAERLLHDAFADCRVTKRREFFTIDPGRVKSALLLAAIEEVTPQANEIVRDSEDRAAIEKAKSTRGRASFGMVGIDIGTTLNFVKDPSITCVVVSESQVEFEGTLSSLSGSALVLLRRLGYDWPSVNGWTQWEYNGQKLSDLLASARSD